MSARITTLGQVRVVAHDREHPGLPQQRLRCALLIYIAVERDCSREMLLRVFWPDRPAAAARHGLSQSLYELRRSIGEDAIVTEGDRVRIGPAVTIDARAFEDAVERGDIDGALGLYQGGFLAGFAVPNANGFDTWADRKRAQIERQHRRARREQMQALQASGSAADVLAAARRWADLDPLEDEAQHTLFALLLAAGERIEARTRFDAYRRALREELDVEPLEETLALFDPDAQTGPAAASLGSGPVTAAQTMPVPAPAPETPRPPVTTRPFEVRQPPVSPRPVYAWAVQGIRRRPALLGALLVLLAAVVAMPWVLAAPFEPPDPEVSSLGVHIEPTGHDPSRVAVLYFEDHSANGELSHIARGLTNDLITELNRVDAISVVSRNGVSQFDGIRTSPREVADRLRVGTIVTGYLQKSGDRLRLTVELVGPDGTQLESDTLHRAMGELFALQDDLVHRVSRFLLRRIGREVQIQRRLTEAGDVEAWERVHRAIERAEEFWKTETAIRPENLSRARDALEDADADLAAAERNARGWSEPSLLRGWVAVGRSRVIGSRDTAAYNPAIREGLHFAQQLIARDSADARAYELRGTLRFHLARANGRDLRYIAVRDSASADLRRAVRLDNSLASAANSLSRLLLFAGEPREAREFALLALDRDAYLRDGADIQNRLYRTSLDIEDYAAANEYCLAGRTDYPADWRFLACKLSIHVFGPVAISPDSARVILRAWEQLDPTPPPAARAYRHTFRNLLYAAILARAGERAGAEEILARAREGVKRNPRLMAPFGLDEAHLCLLLGDTGGALRAVQDYLRYNPHYRTYVARSIQLKPLHGDPRFRSIVQNAESR